MARYNNGMIYTNDNCIGCNKCNFECPVIGANVSVVKNGKNRILVNEKKCIHCGHCLSVCPHNAREYIDDTVRFFDALSNGSRIDLAVSPAFFTAYPDTACQILGYLQSIGAGKIYDVGYGADIAAYCYLRYFEKNKDENGDCPAYLSRNCQAVVNFAECCVPEALKTIIPVHSPVTCLGIYVHKYLREENEIAYISPCVAQKDEFDSELSKGAVKYNVTFAHLMNHIRSIDLSGYDCEINLPAIGLGDIYPVAGGFKEYMEHFLPKEQIVIRTEGLPNRHEEFAIYNENMSIAGKHPGMIDILSCNHGCLVGPATESTEYDIIKMMSGYHKGRKQADTQIFAEGLTYDEKRKRFEKAFENIFVEDFTCEFADRFKQPYQIPQSTYDEIYKSMYKLTPQQKNTNCNSCGYSSCRDMVTAIAYGYNHIENCIHYMNEEIKRLYYTDPVTGVSNKAAFLHNAAELLTNNPDTKYVIAVSDINNFTAINDIFGFEAGNRVLAYLAERGKRFVSGDGVGARLDTDHFAMCFPYTKAKMDFLREPVFYDCHELHIDFPVTLRYGLYIVENAEEQVDKMLDMAAIAMNQKGDRSRNMFFYYNDELREELLSEASITSHMREALGKEEFNIYLQPQYNHATGELIGAEALCRWIKPDGTIISPGDFIPVFEKNGFIRDLDRYMWDKTFAMIRKWLDDGIKPVPISTNISRICLQDTSLAVVFKKLSQKYHVKPELIHLEITESAYMSNQKQIINIVDELHGYGFSVAMDDFGSGYSSLNTLKNLPIDILKLDMGFLRGSGNIEKGSSIISSVINMAQALNLQTIAEGVESLNQADFLESVGCEVIQGYLYAKPMPVGKYEELLGKSK